MEAEDSSASIVSGGRRRTRQPSIGASDLLVSDSTGGLELLVSRVSRPRTCWSAIVLGVWSCWSAEYRGLGAVGQR